MNPEIGSKQQPFPLVRPDVRVTRADASPFTVCSSCMPGWGVKLEPGAVAWMAWYDPPEWQLTSVTFQQVLRPAEVNRLEGFEVSNLDWESDDLGWREGTTHFARLTDKHFEWLATSRLSSDKRILYSFLDEGFDDDWGRWPRRIEDAGAVTPADGGFLLQAAADEGGHICAGAGMFEVQVGDRAAVCLRGIDLRIGGGDPQDAAALEQALLAENYFTEDGELFLFRRFNGRMWNTPSTGEPWDQRYPHNVRMVINGAMFVHWYDCLTDKSVAVGQRH